MMRASAVRAVCVLVLAVVAAPVQGQTLDDARTLLQAPEREQVEMGIQTLGLLGTAEAVAPLVARIREGLPQDLLETAIVTLMALSQPSAGEILYELSVHRRPTIRLRAVEAIAAINPPGAEQALVASLSDADDKVRSAAAIGLGEIEARGALEVLFLALDRGNLHASEAIGKVVKGEDTDRLLGYLGKVPFRSLGPALRQVLTRKDIGNKPKLRIVARLGELATPEVKSYLSDLVATSGESLNSTLSRAILRAMQTIAE